MEVITSPASSIFDIYCPLKSPIYFKSKTAKKKFKKDNNISKPVSKMMKSKSMK